MHAGAQVFVDGIPVELIHRLCKTVKGELWRVKLLFVDPETDDIFIRIDSRVTPLWSPPEALQQAA